MMNNDFSHASPEKKKESSGKRIWHYIKKTLTHNTGWKVASLILAICLWGGLITQDTSLPRDKVIDGVKLTVTNASALRSNGMVVVGGLEEDILVRIRARVPQRYYSTVTAANFTARLDLSQITGTGEQTLKITAASNNTSLYGTVTEVYSPEITLQVAEYATQARVPVEVHTIGEVPPGYYPTAVSCSPQYVDIGGPRDVVEAAVKCVVEFDQSTLSASRNPNTINLDYTFEDALGNALDGTYLTVTSSTSSTALQRIAVSQYVYPMAQVPVDTDHLIRGEAAEGYQVTQVTVNPAFITVAGREIAVAPYLQEGAAIFPYEQIDISGRQKSISTFLALRVPSGMEYVSNSVVQVSVTIEPAAAEASVEADQP